MTRKNRLNNFEVLRCLAMLFIVIWHSCVHGLEHGGGFNLNTNSGFFNIVSTIILCCITGVSVNLYVMISGYFLIEKESFHLRRVEKTWFHTMFYAVGFPLAALVMTPDFLHVKIIGRLFYLHTGYWFVNKYLGLLLISPFLSRFASMLSKRDYQLLLLVLAIINISIYAPFTTMMGEVIHGVSLQWFVFLFFVAGYIRKYKPLNCSKLIFPMFVLFLCINVIYELFKGYLVDSLATPIPYLPYNGFIFFESLFLFLFFRDHRFKSKIWRPFIVLAPYTFGVYLIHENQFVSYFLWQGPFSPMHLTNSWYLIPYIICLSLFVFFICSAIDVVRARIVDSLYLENVLTKLNRFLYTKFSRFLVL